MSFTASETCVENQRLSFYLAWLKLQIFYIHLWLSITPGIILCEIAYEKIILGVNIPFCELPCFGYFWVSAETDWETRKFSYKFIIAEEFVHSGFFFFPNSIFIFYFYFRTWHLLVQLITLFYYFTFKNYDNIYYNAYEAINFITKGIKRNNKRKYKYKYINMLIESIV